MKLGRFLIAFIRPIVKLLYPYTIIGKDNIPMESSDRRLVLCCNHISNLDPVFLMVAQKQHIFFMAKAELFSNKLATWLFEKQFGAFPVHRGEGDHKALDTAVDVVQQGKIMGIFPEGTRSKTGQLGRAKSGAALIAARSGAHILPVALKTKTMQIKMFQRTTIVIGKPVSPQELHLTDAEHPDLRYASRTIMEHITKLLEEAP